MSMRTWEILAILGIIGVLLVLPVAAFGYQSYREAQEGPGTGARPPSVFVPAGDAVSGGQVFANSCASCHGEVGEGSAAGPDIRHMQVGAQFVYTWILDPSGVTPMAMMPRIPLTEKQAADVTAFVMSLKDGNAPIESAPVEVQAPPAAPAPDQKGASVGGDASKGKIVYTSKGCSGCHGPDGKGTAAGPGVVGVAGDAIKTQLRTPAGRMPAFGPSQVSDGDLEDLIAFLSSLK